MIAVRWGDNDSYWGPFTYSPPGNYNPWAIILKSRSEEGCGNNVCTLRISGFSRSIIVALPPLVKPWRQKVYSKYWSDDDIKRMGRDWYWDIKPQEFGFSYDDGFLQIEYGAQTDDSSTDCSWCYHLPWTQWRHVRRSLYDSNGNHYWTEPEHVRFGTEAWKTREAAEQSCPNMTYLFNDFDGELISADTRIEEREWRFGTGWFKWLSLFRKNRVRRYLDIKFSRETGPRKGSWKGGTIGHSIEMLPGELHEIAFQRYCAENAMTFKMTASHQKSTH